MNIFMINTTNTVPDRGGIATYTHELASLFAQWGHTVIVMTYPARGPLPEAVSTRIRYEVARFASYDFSRIRPPKRGSRITGRSGIGLALARKSAFYSMAYARIGRMVWDTCRYARRRLSAGHRLRPSREDITVLWALKWSPEGIAALLAARRLSLPYVVTAHGAELLVAPRGVSGWLYRAVLNGAACVFAVSSHTASLLQRPGIAPRKVVVVPNGVTAERFQRTEETTRLRESLTDRLGLADKKVLVTLASLVPRKGHETVLEALVQIREVRPDVRYLIVGQGPLEQRLRGLVSSLGLGEMVHFLGEVTEDEKAALLQACDLFIMANRDMPCSDGRLDTEGFGIAFLEAGACAKPVIGGRAGGAKEAIVDGETGLLVDPHDPGAIRDGILRLLSDERLARSMGEKARERVMAEFQWSRLGALYLDALKGIRNT